MDVNVKVVWSDGPVVGEFPKAHGLIKAGQTANISVMVEVPVNKLGGLPRFIVDSAGAVHQHNNIADVPLTNS